MRYASQRAFASLWAECAKVSLFPPAARVMEMWEIAAALGVGDDLAATADPQRAFETESQRLLRARWAAAQAEARGDAPPPVPAPATSAASLAATLAGPTSPDADAPDGRVAVP